MVAAASTAVAAVASTVAVAATAAATAAADAGNSARTNLEQEGLLTRQPFFFALLPKLPSASALNRLHPLLSLAREIWRFAEACIDFWKIPPPGTPYTLYRGSGQSR
jgi:hypothetical protein